MVRVDQGHIPVAADLLNRRGASRPSVVVASVVPDRVPEGFGERPVGTGPWRFVQWKHDDFLLYDGSWDDLDAAAAVQRAVITSSAA